MAELARGRVRVFEQVFCSHGRMAVRHAPLCARSSEQAADTRSNRGQRFQDATGLHGKPVAPKRGDKSPCVQDADLLGRRVDL